MLWPGLSLLVSSSEVFVDIVYFYCLIICVCLRYSHHIDLIFLLEYLSVIQVVGDRNGAVFGGLVEAPLRATNKKKYQVELEPHISMDLSLQNCLNKSY